MTTFDNRDMDVTERPSIGLPMAAWALALIGLWPIALVIACLEGGRAHRELAGQYRYMIRTVWIGAIYVVFSAVLHFLLIGPLLMLATMLWYLARCVKAMLALHRGEHLADPRTWLI